MSTTNKRILKALLDITEGTPFFHFATISASSEGVDASVTGDYSSAPQDFVIKPPPHEIWEVHECTCSIRSMGVLQANKYGGAPQLIEGVKFQKKKAGDTMLKLDCERPIKDNADWANQAHEVDVVPFPGNESYVSCRWNYIRGGSSIILDGSKDEYLAVVAEDDFTELTEHTFKFVGISRAQPGPGL